MKNYIFLICISIPIISYAQNAGKLWYIGDHAGLNFKSGTPIAILNSDIHSYDGSSVITDKNDNLLFYTNGEVIWNKFHNTMVNGSNLNGSRDCMHPCTIVKIEKADSVLYYVFTNANVGLPKGLQYSIVDMERQQGQGEVILKNVFIRNKLTEKLIAIPHANHCDFWVITHELGSSRFYVYPVSDLGVAAPIISDVGDVESIGVPAGDGAQGQITASPDGKRIAMASYSNNEYQLFDFDNTTGLISNPISIISFRRPWGVEFSADGTKLYATQWTYPFVYQFDLTNYNQAAIEASATLLGSVPGPNPVYTAGGMQIGPDNKIYIAIWDSDYLSVIDQPNLPGLSANLINKAVYLGGRKSQAGLSYFTKFPKDSSFQKSRARIHVLGNDTALCTPINFSLKVKNPCPTWFDGSMNEEVFITKAGKYWVRFEDCNTIYSDTISISEIICPPIKCAQECKNIEWMNWTISNTSIYTGRTKAGKVTLDIDPLSGSLNTGLYNVILASSLFTPKNIDNMPAPFMPGIAGVSTLIHKIKFDTIANPSDVFILVGGFPNASKPVFSMLQIGKLRAYDKFNRQLQIPNVCEVFQDPLSDNLLPPTMVTFNPNEITFTVNDPAQYDGNIVILKGFPVNTNYLEVEHFDEDSWEWDGVYINVGLPDCCPDLPVVAQIIPCTGDSFSYTLRVKLNINKPYPTGNIFLFYDFKIVKTFNPPFQDSILYDLKGLPPDGKLHILEFYTHVNPDCPNSLNASYFAPNAPLPPVINSDTLWCDKNTLLLNTGSGLTYKWLGPNNFSSTAQNPVIPIVNLNQTGRYYLTVTDYDGCIGSDSIDIKIANKTVATLNKTICDSTVINGQTYRQTGNYTQFLKNSDQCDSILNINLNIPKSNKANLLLMNCDSTIVNGKTYKQTGTYQQVLQNTNFCDSIIDIDLNIFKSSSSDFESESCDSIIVNGQMYLQSGNYTQHLINSNNCDSILRLDLVVQKSSTFNFNLSACDSAIINGQIYSQTGTYKQTLVNTNLCDSILKIDLQIQKKSKQNIALNSCDSVTVNGQTYTQTGIYVQQLKNTVLCDSILTINLNITKSNVAPFVLTSCDTALVNGKVYTQSGNYTQILKNVNGCDSTLNVFLTISNSNSSIYALNSCDSATINGITYKQTGAYTQMLKNSNLCDSTLRINLEILKSSSSILYLTSCDSSIVNGQIYMQTGNYSQVLTGSNTCDSILTINLNIKKSSASNIMMTSCDSAIVNGQIYKQSGKYIQPLINSNGCDSLLNISLNLTKSNSSNLALTSCDTAFINGNTFTESGNYTQTLKNSTDCDSVLNINLNIFHHTQSIFRQSTCDSAIVNAQIYKQSGNYSQLLKNANGCDSLLAIVIQLSKSNSSTVSLNACDSIDVNGIKYNATGSYLQKRINNSGCDSIIHIDLVIRPSNPSELDAGKDTTICEGEIVKLNGFFNGPANFRWQSASGNFDHQDALNSNYYPGSIGDHVIYLTSTDDCKQLSDSLTIHVLSKQNVQVTGDTILDPCKEITFSATGGNDYIWTPASLIECLDPACRTVRLKSPGTVMFTISTEGPCVIPAVLNLSLSKLQQNIYFPNVFSPNGDNINDVFLPLVFCDKLVYFNLQIFDRWGNMLFESFSKDIGWNGKFNAENMNPGVYAYVIQYQLPGSERKIKAGNVTLVR